MRRRSQARNRHHGHVCGIKLVPVPLYVAARRRAHGRARSRRVLGAGRPVYRRHRTRHSAPAVCPFLHQTDERRRHRVRARAVQTTAHAGHGAGGDVLPRKRGRQKNLVQPRRSARADRRQRPPRIRRAGSGRAARGYRRRGKNVQIQKQRRGPAANHRCLRRGHRPPVHDVRQPARAVAGMVGCRRGRRAPLPAPPVAHRVRIRAKRRQRREQVFR